MRRISVATRQDTLCENTSQDISPLAILPLPWRTTILSSAGGIWKRSFSGRVGRVGWINPNVSHVCLPPLVSLSLEMNMPLRKAEHRSSLFEMQELWSPRPMPWLSFPSWILRWNPMKRRFSAQLPTCCVWTAFFRSWKSWYFLKPRSLRCFSGSSEILAFRAICDFFGKTSKGSVDS